MSSWHSRFTLGAALLLILAACSAGANNGPELSPEFDPATGSSEPIINNSGPATAYPYAALVDMGNALCSGAIIAPRVGLTAGHCVSDSSSWTVKTPYANDANNQPQVRKASSAWTEYRSMGDTVNPNTKDVALLFFDQGEPFRLPYWPKIQSTKLPDNTKVMNVGRIDNGQLSYSNLYVGPPITISASSSFPFDYESTEIIESGDSGGPVFLTGGKPHSIVAVNSGAGGGQVLARTDVSYSQIQQMISQHGGSGDDGGAGAGGSGGSGNAGSGGSVGPAGSGGSPSGGCIAEQEPNNTNKAAQRFDVGTLCGSLGTEVDQDWFSWSVPGAGVTYQVSVSGGDAQLLMWKLVNGLYYTIANQDAFTIGNTSNGSGTYLVAIWSPSGTAGDYRLVLKRSDMVDPGPGPGPGPGGSGGQGGGGGSSGTAGSGNSGPGGSGGAAGSGGTTPPAAGDVQWLSYPVQKSATGSNWGQVLTDIEQHLPASYGTQYRDSDWITWAHETTHGINSDVRNNYNTTGKKANGFYVLNNMAVILVEPNMTKSSIAQYVPQSLQGFRFSTYITGQSDWDDMPTYVFDEWVAYTNGTACGVDRVQEGMWNDGWRDQSGNLEFVAYGMATGWAVQSKDPSYFANYPQFRAFIKWQTERSMKLYQQAQAMPEFQASDVAQYYQKMQTASDAESWRQFVRSGFGADWAKTVMGF